MTCRRWLTGAMTVVLAFTAALTSAADQPQWGRYHTRNMVSDETDLPDTFNVETGENILWAADVGRETWGTPVIANGRVLIGTHNDPVRDPRMTGDRGVLLCLDEKTGEVVWQLIVPKLGPSILLDWPSGGLESSATVDGDRAYVVTNRGEVVCLDMAGQANGNDGPYTDEGAHMGLPNRGKGDPADLEVTATDADIIWLFDIPNQAGTYPHDAAHAAILLDGDILYLNTSNAVDETHRNIKRPDGPSLIALDKNTGRLIAKDAERIGPHIFHSTWSSPSMGQVAGRKLVFFGGGDGIVYAFDALKEIPPEGKVLDFNCVWKFDCDPNAPKENINEYLRNEEVSPSNIKGMPVFHNNRIYVAAGGDIWWGKKKAWLFCIDATQTGDVTNSALIWKHDMSRHCCSTSSIHEGMLFITDCGGLVHCLDPDTGRAFWTHDTGGEMWASTMVADGKVYVGTRRKDFFIFAADKQKKILAQIRLDTMSASTPIMANKTLYVTTMRKLYAIQKGTQLK